MSSKSKCFICQIKIEPSSTTSEFQSEELIELDNFIDVGTGGGGCEEVCNNGPSLSKTSQRIEKQLHVIFIFQNILDHPRQTIEKYLKVWGNPEDWVALCQGCSTLVENVKKVFKELQKVQRKFEDAKDSVIDKIRTSYGPNRNRVEGGRKRTVDIFEESRKFLRKKSKTSPTSSFPRISTTFLHGDKWADQVARASLPKDKFAGDNKVFNDTEANLKLDHHDSFDNSDCLDHFSDNDWEPNAEVSTEEKEEQESDYDSFKPTNRKARSSSKVSSSVKISDEKVSVELANVKVSYSDDEFNLNESPKRKARRSGMRRKRLQRSTKSVFAESEDGHLYSCRDCSTSKYKDIEFEQFINHFLKTHRKPYECILCSKGFRNMAPVNLHWRHIHKDALKSFSADQSKVREVPPKFPLIPWFCPVPNCSSEFSSESLRDAHVEECSVEKGTKPDKSFCCEYEGGCEKSYFTEEELRLHLAVCHPKLFKKNRKSPIPCPKCDLLFLTESKMIMHKMSQHLLNRFQCDLCWEQCADKTSLQKHKVSHWKLEDTNSQTSLSQEALCKEQNLKKPISLSKSSGKTLIFACTFKGCDKTFQTRDGRWRHTKTKHAEVTITFPCEICNKILYSKRTLQSHQFIAHRIGDAGNRWFYECKDCGQRSFVKDFHKTHRRICPKKTSNQCEICSTIFSSKKELLIHLKVKHSIELEANLDGAEDADVEDLYPCPQCGKMLSTEYALKVHEKNVHAETFRFTCDIPSCEFKTNSGPLVLSKHKAVMHKIGLEDWTCDKCQYFYKTVKDKKNHVCGQIPQKEKKKYVCTICANEYTASGALKNHIISAHESRRKYNCEMCDFGSNQKTDLARHVARKHGIGDWMCKEEGCKRAFYREDLLQDHIKYDHLGEPRPKTHFCQYCGQAFSLRGTLRSHVQSTHMDSKPYSCEFCGKAFKTAGYRCIHRYKCPMKREKLNLKKEDY